MSETKKEESVEEWLKKLGLERYYELFVKEEITWDVLLVMTESDFKEIGLTLGARKRIVDSLIQKKEQQQPQKQEKPQEFTTTATAEVVVNPSSSISETRLRKTVTKKDEKQKQREPEEEQEKEKKEDGKEEGEEEEEIIGLTTGKKKKIESFVRNNKGKGCSLFMKLLPAIVIIGVSLPFCLYLIFEVISDYKMGFTNDFFVSVVVTFFVLLAILVAIVQAYWIHWISTPLPSSNNSSLPIHTQQTPLAFEEEEKQHQNQKST